MSIASTPTSTEILAKLQCYKLPIGPYDEFFSPNGNHRPHYENLVNALGTLNLSEFQSRVEDAERLLRDNGTTYNPLGDPAQVERPWRLDPLPLILSQIEWKHLTDGLVQRAQLFNSVLLDLYGEHNLIKSRILPPEFIFANPAFQRPFQDAYANDEIILHMYAADLARDHKGHWSVTNDRSDAPLGMGYTLENRLVTARLWPDAFQACQVERLAEFFSQFRHYLTSLTPTQHDNPRVVILSHGKRGPNHFEDLYLARYLGFTLVESGDLAVRDGRVFLKTLGGLLRVHVIWRRMSESNIDPLELNGDASLGVPGLAQAVRQGNVAIVNGLGTALIESPAIVASLPEICRQLRGEELILPSVETKWNAGGPCPASQDANVMDWNVRAAFRKGRRSQLDLDYWGALSHEEKSQAISEKPYNFAFQRFPERSTSPIWTADGLAPRSLGVRVFVAATANGYRVLPGGLARLSADPRLLDQSVLAGELSKDAWVLTDGPDTRKTLLPGPIGVPMLRRGGAELPSRVADSMFWLGRYVERAENGARLFRTLLSRIVSESSNSSQRDIQALIRTLAFEGRVEPGYAVEDVCSSLLPIRDVLPKIILDVSQVGTLAHSVGQMHLAADNVRDRLSHDGWRMLHAVWEQFNTTASLKSVSLHDVWQLVSRAIVELSGFSGLVMESMTRTLGWRFLDLGRRVERSLHSISLIQNALVPSEGEDVEVLQAVLETADSLMTYRSRYLSALSFTPVLDLILTDESNPRSLAFQLAAIQGHVEQLPRDPSQPLRGPEERISIAALHSLRLAEMTKLCERNRDQRCEHLQRLMERLFGQLPKLADLIAQRYLLHVIAPRHL